MSARAGVHDHARGFVDRDHIVILIEDFERQILGYRVERNEISRLYLDLFRAFQQISALGGCAVHLHAALVDPRLQPRPAVLRKLIVQELVQALAGVGG